MILIATLILMFLMVSGLTIAFVKHGEQRTDKWNFFTQLIATIIEVILFYFAGLFDIFIN